MNSQKGIYRSGTSGLTLPVPNKQGFPPAFRDKSRLTYYSSLLTSIEVNSSFYKLPQARTVKKWVDIVPDNFVFTFKLWKEITHVKGFAFKREDVVRFVDIINEAAHKKACILVQFPPSLTVDKFAGVERLLEILQDRAHEWKIALEFRHPSWYIAEVYELADEYHSSVVVHDIPRSRNGQFNEKASFVYLRFHGPKGDYRGGYADAYLQEQAQHIKTWRNEGRDVYAYFNNTIDDAFKNAVTLDGMVAADTSAAS